VREEFTTVHQVASRFQSHTNGTVLALVSVTLPKTKSRRNTALQIEKQKEKVQSGGMAPVSGLYRTDHPHAQQQEFWISKDQRFPKCPICGNQAAFMLEQEVEHISRDADFS
jgi:hypothetical protein